MMPSTPPAPAEDRRVVCIVVTPGSGEGRAWGVARRLRRILRRRGHAASIQSFPDLETLSAWAHADRPDFSVLLCVGGDATQSAAAALARRWRIPFAPVPNGFGNLFASVFGHTSAPRRVAQLVRTGVVRLVDVGTVDGDDDALFLSHRSYGVLEHIQEAVEAGRRQPRERARRHAAYYARAARAFWRLPLDPWRVEVDGAAVAEDAVVVTVANVETYRGFLNLTPSASPMDGRFDVFVMPRTSRPGLAWRLLRLKLGLPGRWRGVALFRGREVVVSTARKRDTLRVSRRALPLLVPAGAIEAFTQRRVEEAPEPTGA